MAINIGAVRRLFDFSGRIGRVSYLSRLLFVLAGAFVLLVLESAPGESEESWVLIYRMTLATIFVGVATCLKFSSAAKRLHDLGWSGGWSAMLLVPGLNLVLFLVCLVASANDLGNSYGARDSG